LDYYDSNAGAPFALAAQLNGVSAPTNVVVPASTSAAAGSAVASGSASKSGTANAANVTTSKLSGAGSRKDGTLAARWAVGFMGVTGMAVGILAI
jgi:hypothetical protein